MRREEDLSLLSESRLKNRAQKSDKGEKERKKEVQKEGKKREDNVQKNASEEVNEKSAIEDSGTSPKPIVCPQPARSSRAESTTRNQKEGVLRNCEYPIRAVLPAMPKDPRLPAPSPAVAVATVVPASGSPKSARFHQLSTFARQEQ
ncbi:hypothetical protein ACROYT_G024281 [Oculina patagonica]